MSVILVDIDGTLADITHRLHFIKGDRFADKDWDAFFDAMVDDTPIWFMVALVAALAAAHWDVIYVTGRPDIYRQQTSGWLDKQVTGERLLYMRKAGDRRPDDVVKREILQQIRSDGFEPVMAIDDRKRVVDMWRAEGLICLQCAEGDF